jgi:hypothetical protein
VQCSFFKWSQNTNRFLLFFWFRFRKVNQKIQNKLFKKEETDSQKKFDYAISVFLKDSIAFLSLHFQKQGER